MATGSFASIASYNGTGTQGLAVVDKIKDEDEDVMSVFWNKTDTDKQILHGSNILEIPTSTSNKQGTWGGSQTFSVNPEVDCIGDIYLALNVDFNIPESSLVEEQYPRTITTLLQKPSDPNHEFLNNTQPVGYSLKGIKKGDTEPKSSIIGYQQGFKRDESISYDANGIPSAYSQNGYPNRGDGDDEHWMELPAQRKTLKGLRTYYDTNTSTGEEPNELVNTGILSKSDSVHMTTVDTQVNQPHDNSGNILEGFNNWINTSLIETANDNHLSAKVTDGPPPGRFPGVLTEEDANEIKHTGNEFLALDENGEFEIYKSEGVVASDLFKSYLNRNDIDNLVNYYNDNTTRSYPLETLNETSGLQDGEVKSITAGSFSINDQEAGNTDFNGECVVISEDGNTMAVGQGFTISRDGLVTAGVKDVAHNVPWNTYLSAEAPYGTWSHTHRVEGVPIGHYMKRPDNLSIDDTVRHIGKVRVYKKKKGIWVLSGVLHPPKSTFTPPKRTGVDSTIVPGPQNEFDNGNTIFTDPSSNGMTLEWTGKNQHSSIVNPDLTANTPADLNAESTNFAGFTQGGLHGFTNNKYISINADGTRIVVAESNKNSGAPYNGWSGTFDYTETDGWKFINEGYVGRYSRADMDYKGIPGVWDISLSGDGNSLASLDLRALAGNTTDWMASGCAPIEMMDYKTWKLGGISDRDYIIPGDYDDPRWTFASGVAQIFGDLRYNENAKPWQWAWFITEYGRRHRWDSNYDVNREDIVKTHSFSKSWARASLERILDSKTVPFSDFIRMRPRMGHRILSTPVSTSSWDFQGPFGGGGVIEPRDIKASYSGYMNSISFRDHGIEPSNPYEPSTNTKEDFDTARNAINTENQTNSNGTTFARSTIPFNHYSYFKEATFPGGGESPYVSHPCNVWIRYWDSTNHGPNKDDIGGIGYNDSDRINGWINHKVDYFKDSGLFGRGDKDIWHQYIYRKWLNFHEALIEHEAEFMQNGGSYGHPHAPYGYLATGYPAPWSGVARAYGVGDILATLINNYSGWDAEVGYYDGEARSNVHDMPVNPNYTRNPISDVFDPNHANHGILQNLDFKLPEIINLYIRNTYIAGEPERWAAKCVKMSSDGNRIVYITDAPTPVDRRSLPLETYSTASGAVGGLLTGGGSITDNPSWPTPANCEVRVIEKKSTGNWVYMTHSSGDMYSGLTVPTGHEAIDMTMSSDGNTVAVYSKRPNLYPKWAWEETRRIENGKSFELDVESYDQTINYTQAGSNINTDYDHTNFGSSIAVSGDGMRVIVGAPLIEYGYNNTGMVYIYDWTVATDGTGSWQQLGNSFVGDGPNSLLGTSVAINYDGSRIAMGAPESVGSDPNVPSSHKGYVRVYESNHDTGGGWVLLGDEWDITGGPYNATNNTPTWGVGTTISMNAAGDRIAVGLPFIWSDTGHTEVGAVKIYNYSTSPAPSGSWNVMATLTSPNISDHEKFGRSVALSDDGNRLIIGTAGSMPKVYEYDISNVVWNLIYSFDDYLYLTADGPSTHYSTFLNTANCVSISGDGTVIAVGNSTYWHAQAATYPVPNCGAVMVLGPPPEGSSDVYFLRQIIIGSTAVEGANPEGEEIGKSVALNSDGTILSYGAVIDQINENGNVRLHLWDGTEYKSNLITANGPYSHIVGDPGDMIASPNPEPSVPMSLSSQNTLSISADGLTIAAGLPLKDPGPTVGHNGEARVFKGVSYPIGVGGRPGSYNITVYNGKYMINEVETPNLTLIHGNIYIFTWPTEHPLRFSSTPDGTHNGGFEYIPVDGTNVLPDSKGGIYTGTAPILNIFEAAPGYGHTVIRVAKTMPTLYYYCENHSGMGGRAATQKAVPWIEPLPEDGEVVYDSFINDGFNDMTRGVGEPAITLHSIIDGVWQQIGQTIYPEGYKDTGFRHKAVMADRIGSETPVFESPLNFIDNHWKYPRMKYSLDLNSDGSRLVIGAPMNIPEDSGYKTIDFYVDITKITTNQSVFRDGYNINNLIQPKLELVKLNTYNFNWKPASDGSEPVFSVSLTPQWPGENISFTYGTPPPGNAHPNWGVHTWPSFHWTDWPDPDGNTFPYVITTEPQYILNSNNNDYSETGPDDLLRFVYPNFINISVLESAGVNFSDDQKPVTYLPFKLSECDYLSVEFSRRTTVYLITTDHDASAGRADEYAAWLAAGPADPNDVYWSQIPHTVYYQYGGWRAMNLSNWEYIGEDRFTGPLTGATTKLYKRVYEAGSYEHELDWFTGLHLFQDSSAAESPLECIFKFSTTPDGTHNSGVEYTNGVNIDLINKVTTIQVAEDTPTLYYYSENTKNMGGRVSIINRTSRYTSDFYRNFNGIDEYIVPCGEVLVYDKNPDNTYTLKNRISKDDKHNKSDYSTKPVYEISGTIPYTVTDSNGDILYPSHYSQTSTLKINTEYIGSGQDSGYRFGSSVCISGDGNTISIGAPETGVQTVEGSEVISGASDIANTLTYTATAEPVPGPKKKPGDKFAKVLDVFNLVNQAQKRSNYDITDFSNLPDIGEPINWKKQFKEVPEGAILPPELDEYDNPQWASSDLRSKVTFPLSKIIKRIEFTVGTQIWQILEHDDILAINATELPESSYRRLGLQSHGFLRSDGTRESTKIDNWIPGKSYQAVIPLPVLTKTIGGQLENFTQNTEDGYLSFLAKDQEVKVRVFYSNFEDIWDVNEVFATKGFTAPIYNLENKQRGFGQYITNAPIPWKPDAILTSKLFGKHFIMAKEEKEYFKNNRGRFGKNIISTSTPWKRNTIRTGNLFGKNLIMAMEKDTIIPKRVKTSQNVNKIFPRELYPDTKIIIDLDSFSLYSSHLIITSNFPSFSDKTKIPVLKSAELFLNSESFSGIMNASILKGITNKSLGLYSNEFNIDNLDTAAGNEYYVFPLASRAFGGSSIPLDRFDNIRLELMYTSPGLNEFGIEISEMANINVTCRGEMLVTYKDGVSTIKLY